MGAAFDAALSGLNDAQRRAVTARDNTVVTAGAGSGKTTVLAYRYANLVMRRGLSVEEILTLTFTNKATNEMSERIYKTLSQNSGEESARKAVSEFYKANIQTLDSLCAKIARSGAALFGIAPDFTSGNAALADMARNAALAFVLDRRENPALRSLSGDGQIQAVADMLFARTLLSYSSITRPLDFDKMLDAQIRAALNDYKLLMNEIEAELGRKKNPPAMPESANFNVFFEKNNADNQNERAKLCGYYTALSDIRGCKNLSERFASLANFALGVNIVREIFLLLAKFQDMFNRQKRMASLLSFTDIAHLAIDTLIKYPDIRRVYKTRIKAIMVDEFQDNNTLQKELLFLLAEDEERGGEGLPASTEISSHKLFFVGDEKQSIYRFRGADVAVFRSLGAELGCEEIQLETNYRSRPELIEAFNLIFKRVLAPRSDITAPYEAKFSPHKSPAGAVEDNRRHVHFALFLKDDLPRHNNGGPGGSDMEAAYIACEILRITTTPLCVLKKGGGEKVCEYGDIAVLVRSKSHQNELERALSAQGIPYNAEEPASLFNESLVNDFTAYLRILAYPRDTLSYAALLRSPFVRVSDIALTVILLKFAKTPFDEAAAAELSGEDRQKYINARETYLKLARLYKEGALFTHEIISALWYEAGYRFESLFSRQGAGEIYDYFFELAVRASSEGKTLCQFLAYLEELSQKGISGIRKKLEGLDIPIERSQGVRILTVHKSKGLEFPVVFLYGAGESETERGNRGAFYFTETQKDGALFTLNLPKAREFMQAKCANHFYLKYQNEEKRMSEAELRRILYVALTRAESELYITASVAALTQDEINNSSHDDIGNPLVKRVKLFHEKLMQSERSPSLLNLFVPALACENDMFWDINSIPYKSWDELRSHTDAAVQAPPKKSMEEAALKYGAVNIEAEHEEPAAALNASDMGGAAGHLRQGRGGINPAPRRHINAAEFGTMVHAVIEERFKNISGMMPASGGLKKAYVLADVFFDSALGKRSLAAQFRKTEFPFISLLREEKRTVYINGKIDLLFRDETGLVIVDYKTDKKIEPDSHGAQLGIYLKAARELFPREKNYSAYLFYLRHGKAVEIKAF
ncbi:MAG: UvrD-helicase domain-containing protein [Spirochaetaceae bacterium]|nr:UvrD-helicase domain-containing protein [Spirochaetaceae bacterium]